MRTTRIDAAPVTQLLTIGLFALRLAMAAALFVFALYWRSPILASIRMPALVAFLVVAAALIAFEVWCWRRKARPRSLKALSAVVVLVTAAALALTLTYEAQFHWQKRQVLQASTEAVARLGRHVIVGYRDAGELRELIRAQLERSALRLDRSRTVNRCPGSPAVSFP